jgi:hypothetical protein
MILVPQYGREQPLPSRPEVIRSPGTAIAGLLCCPGASCLPFKLPCARPRWPSASSGNTTSLWKRAGSAAPFALVALHFTQYNAGQDA